MNKTSISQICMALIEALRTHPTDPRAQHLRFARSISISRVEESRPTGARAPAAVPRVQAGAHPLAGLGAVHVAVPRRARLLPGVHVRRQRRVAVRLVGCTLVLQVQRLKILLRVGHRPAAKVPDLRERSGVAHRRRSVAHRVAVVPGVAKPPLDSVTHTSAHSH